MSKKHRITFFIIAAAVIAVLATLSGIVKHGSSHPESIQTVMQDQVLHGENHIVFLGMEVNPGFISSVIVTGIFLVFCLIVRFIVIPRFKNIPGKFQLLLETAVGLFDNIARSKSPHLNSFLGAYIFSAGAYIFIGTVFELLGIQAVASSGLSISLPAPLADINGAIMMGCLSYLVIMSGGLIANGFKGILKTLKDFSLPISMSFRLFGAMLSGALVTELVYYYPLTRYGIPVIVGVMFTLLHALIQAYVLTTLTSVFYGESSEKTPPKPKKIKKKKNESLQDGSILSEIIQTENTQTENAQTENAQTENAQTENAQTENAQKENAQTENAQTENIQTENTQAENAQTKNAQTENTQTENTQTENTQTENAQKNIQPADGDAVTSA